jgi:predicted transcriptional regulator of viral defense system
VGTTSLHLAKGFFDKLAKDIKKASSQLLAFDNGAAARRIVYVVFNFDDRLHEYADEYQRQIKAYIASASLLHAEVVLDVKPPFHSAV